MTAAEARYWWRYLLGLLTRRAWVNKCHLCRGRGLLFEADGWFIPAWATCHWCGGSGRRKLAELEEGK